MSDDWEADLNENDCDWEKELKTVSKPNSKPNSTKSSNFKPTKKKANVKLFGEGTGNNPDKRKRTTKNKSTKSSTFKAKGRK